MPTASRLSLGELPLAGATLGFTLGNVTGFSLLNGLCGAMEPICGQAFGANNARLLHKTLLMATSLLLAVSLPVAFLWLNAERILINCGQQREIAAVARRYLIYLIPDLVVTSFLCPLKAYLSTQNVTVPIMLSSAAAVALHILATLVLARARGLEGVLMAVWISDLVVAILLAVWISDLDANNSSSTASTALPPMAALFGGEGFLCGITADTSQGLCWDSTGFAKTSDLVPEAFKINAYSHIASDKDHVCAICKSYFSENVSGTVGCWDVVRVSNTSITFKESVRFYDQNASSLVFTRLVSGDGFSCGVIVDRGIAC